MIDEVKRAVRQNPVLFLGYDISDAGFWFLFNEVVNSRFARVAYAAWPGLSEDQVRMWRERGIAILDVEPLALLDKLMGTITPLVQAPRAPRFRGSGRIGLRPRLKSESPPSTPIIRPSPPSVICWRLPLRPAP